jgi:hypothetical protein
MRPWPRCSWTIIGTARKGGQGVGVRNKEKNRPCAYRVEHVGVGRWGRALRNNARRHFFSVLTVSPEFSASTINGLGSFASMRMGGLGLLSVNRVWQTQRSG